ncbi:MAG: hypothetical protein WCT08_06325 [Patescibacteria group bacterium]|jgi:hypothetical protein
MTTTLVVIPLTNKGLKVNLLVPVIFYNPLDFCFSDRLMVAYDEQ